MDGREIGWTISIDVEDKALPPLDDDRYFDLSEAFLGWGGSVGGRTTHAAYGSIFSFRTALTDPVHALDEGLTLFRRIAADVGLPELPVTRCELMTFSYHDRWLAT